MPDGRFGAGIRVSKVGSSGSSIRLTWDVSTCQAAGYHLIYGELSGVAEYTLDGARCDLGSQGVVNWTTVPTGNIWFVVIGDDGEGTEGSWGQDSGEADRNRSISSGFCGNSLRDNAGTCPPSP